MSLTTSLPRRPRSRKGLPVRAAAAALIGIAAATTAPAAHAGYVTLYSAPAATPTNGATVETVSNVTITYKKGEVGQQLLGNAKVVEPDGPRQTTALKWANPVPGSKWITPFAVKDGGVWYPEAESARTGNYTYTHVFSYSENAVRNVFGKIITDDFVVGIAGITLNGTALNYVKAPGNVWQVYSSVNGSAPLLNSGTNTLEIIINNQGRNTTGVSYALTVTPEPGVVAFGILSAAGVGGLLLRGRFRTRRSGGPAAAA